MASVSSLRLRSGRSVAGVIGLRSRRNVVAGAGRFGFGADFSLRLAFHSSVRLATDNRFTFHDLAATAALHHGSCIAAGRLRSAAGRFRGAANRLGSAADRFRGAANGLRRAARSSLASVQACEQTTATVVATMMAEQPATAVVAMMAEQAATTVAAAMMTEQAATATSATAMTGLDRFAGEHGAADQQRDRHSNTNYISTHSNSLQYDVSY